MAEAAKYVFAFAFLICILNACSAADYITGEGEAKRIRQVGRKGEAKIIEIWDTGMTVNDDPIVGFKLLVSQAGSESYEARTQGLVSRLHIPQVQPGMVIPVAIDPNDVSKVAIAIYKD